MSTTPSVTANKMIMMPKNIDLSKIQYTAPKKLDNGGKIVSVFYDKSPLILQTPYMPVPYGMNDWQGDNGVQKFSVNLSFTGAAENPAMQTILDVMKGLDDKLVADACQNSFAWLGKKSMSDEVARELYTPVVKLAKDKDTGEFTDKYPPTMKVTLPFRDGKFACEAYNGQREQLDIKTNLVKRSKVSAILQCTGVWVAGGRYGTSWKALQMKIDRPEGISGYAFAEDDEDDAGQEDDN